MAKKKIAKDLALIQESGLVHRVIPSGEFGWKICFIPNDGIWTNAYLIGEIRFSDKYPFEPPGLRMFTRVFHPNVHPETGTILLQIEKWQPATPITTVFESFTTIFASPKLEEEFALNEHAVNVLKQDYDRFKAMNAVLIEKHATKAGCAVYERLDNYALETFCQLQIVFSKEDDATLEQVALDCQGDVDMAKMMVESMATEREAEKRREKEREEQLVQQRMAAEELKRKEMESILEREKQKKSHKKTGGFASFMGFGAASSSKGPAVEATFSDNPNGVPSNDSMPASGYLDPNRLMIRDALLSPNTALVATQVGLAENLHSIRVMNKKEITDMLKHAVPGIAKMMDRLGSVPVSAYIISTYESGLPNIQHMTAVNNHTIFAIRFIFDSMQKLPRDQQTKHLSRLAEAYQSCQAVQARVIDSIYALLSGREKTFRDQILLLLDEQKTRVLDEVTYRLNHGNIEPHTQSAYRAGVGDKLGLSGVDIAKNDRLAPSLAKNMIKDIELCFRRLFVVEELADAIVAGVNSRDAQSSEFCLSHKALCDWVATDAPPKFPKHSIFFDEEHADWYPNRPAPGTEFEPFLCRQSAMCILQHMFCFK